MRHECSKLNTRVLKLNINVLMYIGIPEYVYDTLVMEEPITAEQLHMDRTMMFKACKVLLHSYITSRFKVHDK
jgi:hypothetical protein